MAKEPRLGVGVGFCCLTPSGDLRSEEREWPALDCKVTLASWEQSLSGKSRAGKTRERRKPGAACIPTGCHPLGHLGHIPLNK